MLHAHIKGGGLGIWAMLKSGTNKHYIHTHTGQTFCHVWFSNSGLGQDQLSNDDFVEVTTPPTLICIFDGIYFLNMSVACLIDGELLSRELAKLSTFMPKLKYSCATISDIETHPS